MAPSDGHLAADTQALTRRREAWSDFWATGTLHSLTGSLPDRFGGAIGEFWESRAIALGPRARLLEVGTGNGALPRLMLDRLGDHCPTIDAVDVAAIRADWHRQSGDPRVRFHESIEAEHLPFDNGAFDAVASQFALEYTALDASLGEIARVLKPGGHLWAVMHAADSVLARTAEAEASHIRWLLEGGGFLDAAERLLPYMARAGTPERGALSHDVEANAARHGFANLQRALGERAAGATAPDVLLEARSGVARLLSGALARGDAGTAQEALSAYRHRLEMGYLRTLELVQHAVDDSRLAALVSVAESLGLAVQDTRPLPHEDGRLLALGLTARRA